MDVGVIGPRVPGVYITHTHLVLQMAQSGPVIDEFGNQQWFKDGKLHREGGPACVFANGDTEWYKDGQRHRDDGPASMYAKGNKGIDMDGSAGWYHRGVMHRDIGPAFYGFKWKPMYVHHGIARMPHSVLGETMGARSPASWSPVLYFI